MRTLISSLVLISSLTACGGADNSTGSVPDPIPCTINYQVTDWSACQPDGTQTRGIVSQTASEFGCAAAKPALTQSCTYTPPAACAAQTPATCKVSDTLTMCCPAGVPYYCASLNVCVTSFTTASCPELPTICSLPIVG